MSYLNLLSSFWEILPNTEIYMFTEETHVRENRPQVYVRACMCVCTIFAWVHVHGCNVCLWRGKVSPGALAPPQTRLLLTSVSQLADWRENIPAPSLPHPPSLPSMHPFLHKTTPTNKPSSQLGSAASSSCLPCLVWGTGGGALVTARGWEGSGGDEVGCQECGSWSALLCVLCKMNRPMAGWGASRPQCSVDLCVRKAWRPCPVPLETRQTDNEGCWVNNLNAHYV